MDRLATLNVLRARLAGSGNEVLCAYLFGSVARDEERADSDLVDNAILRDVASHRLDDLLAFVDHVRARLRDR